MAIELRQYGSQDQVRSVGPGDTVCGVMIQVADLDTNRKTVIKSDDPGIQVVT